MPVPTQRQMHLPILQILTDVDSVVHFKVIRDTLAERFSVTEAELAELVPSGRTTRFDNRAWWGTSYLKRAGLIGSPSRSHYAIVPAGKDFLATYKDDTIPIRELKDLIEERKRADNNADSEEHPSETITVEPDDDIALDEQMDALYKELDAALTDHLLDIVKGLSPPRFEGLVVNLLEAMGYGEGRQIGGSGDQGIDGVINQDPLGLELVYIQAKRKQDTMVGEPEIRNFAGSLDVKGANKGVFITTSSFSQPAKNSASSSTKTIRLIDGRELAELMIKHNVGVITEITYALKKPDENYFSSGPANADVANTGAPP